MGRSTVLNYQEFMLMEEIASLAQYEELVAKYKQKRCFSNDYLQSRITALIDKNAVMSFSGKNNVFLFERKHKCLRLYYYLNDLEEDMVFNDCGDLVSEIIYRGERFFPNEEVYYLKRNGFLPNLIRDQYSACYSDLNILDFSSSSVVVCPARSVKDVIWACQMFNSTFDYFSGDYIVDEIQSSLWENNQIIIALDDEGKRLGALHQTKERGVAWISHVAVKQDARGKHVGTALVRSFIETNHTDDKSRYMLWVQRQNESAVSMYKKFGFKYINKSTLSMLKINS